MANKHRSGCGCGPGCCCSEATPDKKKQVVIDFLYLDLSACTRCQGTDKNLDGALEEVARVLDATGAEVVLNKINVATPELAEKHQFLSSPTIRVNGRDIQLEITENNCESCGDLCGTEVDCRTWSYQGVNYDVPPKAMIIDAILREVYGASTIAPTPKEYIMPENLRRFYAALKE